MRSYDRVSSKPAISGQKEKKMDCIIREPDGTQTEGSLSISHNGWDWTGDFIGNGDGLKDFEYNGAGAYLVDREDFDWWQDAIECYDTYNAVKDALREVLDDDDVDWDREYTDLTGGDYCISNVDVAMQLSYLVPDGMCLVQWYDGSYEVRKDTIELPADATAWYPDSHKVS
jgi:hypothetical protein